MINPPQFRPKVMISSETNRAFRDILSPTSVGSYVESVEPISYGLHNTKITIMVDKWINGVNVDNLGDRYARRVILYNRVNLAAVLPAGVTIPGNLAQAIALLNSKYRLDLTTDDVEIVAGKVTAKPTSLGYYDEQIVGEAVHYIDRVNFFWTPRIRWFNYVPNGTNDRVNGFNIVIDGELDYIQTPVLAELGVTFENYLIEVRNILAGYFETRMDLDFEIAFDTTTNIIDPSDDVLKPRVTPSIMILNKTTREISISINILGDAIGQNFPLLQKVILAPMGTSISEVPSKRKTIVTDEVNGLGIFTDSSLRLDNQAILKLKLNDGEWIDLISPGAEAWSAQYVPAAIRALTDAGVNNQIRVLMAPTLSNSIDMLSWRYMFENITSQRVKVAIEFYDGKVVEFELGPDDQLAEPYMHRYLTTMEGDFGWWTYQGSYNGYDKSYLKLGTDINAELLGATNSGNVFSALTNNSRSWSEEIDLNLWGDLTSPSLYRYVLIVTNLTQKTLPFSIDSYFLENGTVEGNVSVTYPIWICHPTVLGPAGVVGEKLDFVLPGTQPNGRAIEMGVEEIPAAANIIEMGLGMRINGTTDVAWSSYNDGVRHSQFVRILSNFGAICIAEGDWKPGNTSDDEGMVMLLNNPFPQVDTLYQFRVMGQEYANLNLDEASFIPKPSIFRAIELAGVGVS